LILVLSNEWDELCRAAEEINRRLAHARAAKIRIATIAAKEYRKAGLEIDRELQDLLDQLEHPKIARPLLSSKN
jgi:hypothetical protein